MRPHPILPRVAALAFLVGIAVLPACSSDNKTIVALTINSDDTVGAVDKVVVTATTAGKSAITTNVDPAEMDSGAIVSSFFTRIELDGWSGTADLKVDATTAAGTVAATATTTVELRENGAVAARVNLSNQTPEPTPDGGANDDASEDGGSSDDGSGSDVN